MIISYFVVGVTFYTQFARPKTYTISDAIYYCIVTITTVGYGELNTDYEDTSDDVQMLFTSFFVFYGVGIVGAALGIVCGVILDREEAMEAALTEQVVQAAEQPWCLHHLSKVQSKLLVSWGMVIVLVGLGTLCFAWIEDKRAVEAFYWSCITITTVGYGDVTPKTDIGKWFACVYLLVGTVLMAKALADIAAVPLQVRRQHMEEHVLSQYGHDLDAGELAEIVSDSHLRDAGLIYHVDGSCTRAEFVISMLLKLEKINKGDIQRCTRIFDGLDEDGSGVLDTEDVVGAQSLDHE